MSELTPQKCPRCGTEQPASGVCPRCAAQLLQATQTDIPGEGTPVFTPPTIEELAGKFPQLEIIKLIGRGGMGAVYQARQRVLDRLVALKILPPDIGRDTAFAERFAREARALAKLNHPGIVTIHDFGRTDGLYFFLMEYVDGMNLRELLQNGRISAREALAIVPQICDALQYAHDQGIVHRDIKPENLLIDRRGRVKVADFGLAKLMGAAAEATMSAGATGESPALTEAGKVMGTPNYMSPEQVDHPEEVDHRADIYALGVVFYQMLTGELPDKQLQPPSKKVRIDVRLDEVVLRALEKQPERRYQSASVLKTQVETIASGSAGPAAQDSPVLPAIYRGMDYKSKATLFGLPWLHVTSGINPGTGKVRVSRGIIAIGGVAQGVVAFGGVAMGGITFGGLSVGIFSYGGLVVGLIAMGGVALGLAGAIGGLAIGTVALGGLALGIHNIDALSRGPAATNYFTHWGSPALHYFQTANYIICTLTLLAGIGLPWWLRRRASQADKTARPQNASPFLPLAAREIYAHMTAAENLAYQKFAWFYGLWNAETFFVPFAIIEFLPLPVPLNWIAASAILLVGLSGYPLMWKKQAKLLCDTAWAREKAYAPESLRMFAFGSTGLMLLGVLWLVFVAVLWWQTYRPDGVWQPWLAEASIKEPSAGGSAEVTEVKQYGQTVWLHLTCDPLPPSAVLSPYYSGPMIELPYHLPAAATNADCLVTTAPHSGGKIIAGTGDLSGRTNFTLAFVLPDETAAAAAVKLIRRMNLNQPHGVDSPLFILRRTLGKDANGRVMEEDIDGWLQLSAREGAEKPTSSPAGQPVKTITLTQATNGMCGPVLRTVEVTADTTLFQGEKLYPIIIYPNGQVKKALWSLAPRRSGGHLRTSAAFSWALHFDFQTEAGAAIGQIQVGRVMALTNGVPVVVFCATNSGGYVLTGAIEFDRTGPESTKVMADTVATVRIDDSFGFPFTPRINYAAYAPEGYVLNATANHGRQTTFSGISGYVTIWEQPFDPHHRAATPFIWAVPIQPLRPEMLTRDEELRRIDAEQTLLRGGQTRPPAAGSSTGNDLREPTIFQQRLAVITAQAPKRPPQPGPATGLSPEQQAILIEAERTRMLDQPNRPPMPFRPTGDRNVGTSDFQQRLAAILSNTLPAPSLPATHRPPPWSGNPIQYEGETFEVTASKPRLIFSVTNGPGDVYQGFLEIHKSDAANGK